MKPAPRGRDLVTAARRLYDEVHRDPELSGEEARTSVRLAEALRAEGLEVTRDVGGHGVVGLLRNGRGPTVMLRTELDALPVQEQTGLAHASRRDGVMHACGHDLHLAACAGAAAVLARSTGDWRGTLMVLGQPAEETLSGAAAMLADGLYERFERPDLVLAQHVGPLPAGTVAHATGVLMAASLTLRVVLHGRGGHAAAPHMSVDPVLAAAALVMRLQGVVARETAPEDRVVVTVASLHAGYAANVLPDDATLEVTVRAVSDGSLARAEAAVRRIATAEAAASGCPHPPSITVLSRSAAVVPTPEAVSLALTAHRAALGEARVRSTPPIMATEDIGLLTCGGQVPMAYWLLGGAHPQAPRSSEPNHSPRFSPAVGPTLATGISALVTAASAGLSPA